MLRKYLLATAIVSASAISAHAASVGIDSFDTTAFQTITAPSLGSTPFNPATTTAPTADAIGGNRTLSAQRTSPVGTGNAFGNRVTAKVTGGIASVGTSFGVEGFAIFSWDSGGVDLVDGTNDSIAFDLLEQDLPGVDFTFSVGAASVTQTTNAPGLVSFDFADFVGVDLTNVGGMSLRVSGPAAFDVQFDDIRAQAAPVSTVPLPAAGFLVLGGLGALGALRGRRKT